jgi:transcriptional regulator GlxA family with amidase domain
LVIEPPSQHCREACSTEWNQYHRRVTKADDHASPFSPLRKINMSARIDLLYSSDCLSGALLNTIDVLRAANTIWRLRNPNERNLPLYWSIIDGNGNQLPLPPWLADTLVSPGPMPDLPAERTALFVPGLWTHSTHHLTQLLGNAKAESALIAARHAAGAVLAASYTGPAVLAHAGVLDGRHATVTWLMAGWFGRTFPKVRLMMDRPITADGNIYCAGAPASHTSLVLALIQHFVGDEVAQTCANVMQYEPIRFQQAGLISGELSKHTRDGVVYKAKQWLEQHVTESYSLNATAQAAAVSPRTLLRYFREVVGMTPLDYLHRLRIERAKQLLEVTLFDLRRIIEMCGYQDPCAFRRLFRRETGISPSEYRRAYAVRSTRRWWRADDTPHSAATD